MKKVAIYGTGGSAQALLEEIGDEVNVVQFVETTPTKSQFRGRPVRSVDDLTDDVDQLYIASMFFPEIMELLLDKGFPIKKVQIAIALRDDPRYGTIRLSSSSVVKKISEYRLFRQEIERIRAFVESKDPLHFKNRLDHLLYAFSQAPITGALLEFGVYRGESLLHLATNTDRKLWGFDSFAGFADDVAWKYAETPEREELALPEELVCYPFLVKGFFEESLPHWMTAHDQQKIAFVHYDAGHYDTAKFVLKTLRPRLEAGCVIVFDEFIPSPIELRADEFDALNDEYGSGYEILSVCEWAVAVRVL